MSASHWGRRRGRQGHETHRLELGRRRVRPGYGLSSRWIDAGSRAYWTCGLGETRELSGVVVFPASNESSYMAGSEVVVDGGQTI